MSNRHPARWSLLLLVSAALAIYLATLDNGLRPGELAGGDLITHQYAQVQARPSNAPGYPLYTMGGWLWFHGLRSLLGPSSNPTPILSAYSTLWALLALGLLYQLILDLTDNWLIGLLTAAFYATTYFFWYYAASTEQYTSAVAQTIAIVLLAFRWDSLQDRIAAGLELSTREKASLRRSADRYLVALAFLSGLSLAHLVTVAFIVPPLLWFILSRQSAVLRRPKLMVRAIGVALVPLAAYAFVYVRGAQHPEWRGAGQWPSTWTWFWDFVSTQQGREELTWALQPLWTSEFPSLIWGELTWVVLVGGIAGLFLLGRRRSLFLGSTLLIYLAFSFVDRLGNWFQVIMPAYPLVVVCFAVALNWLWQRTSRDAQQRQWTHGAIVAGLVLLIFLRLSASLPRANQRDRPEDTALTWGRSILVDEPASQAAVLGTFTETLSLRYLTDIWKQRPDVEAVGSVDAERLLSMGSRPLYVTNAAVPVLREEVRPDVHLSSAGATLINVHTQPVTSLPDDIHQLAQPVGDGLILAGYAVEPLPSEDMPGWHVRLFWQAGSPITHDWSISLRPTENGQLISLPDASILQTDVPHPVHGLYPTSGWTPGEIVADDYMLPLPKDRMPDGLEVVVYRPVDTDFENLAVLSLPLMD